MALSPRISGKQCTCAWVRCVAVLAAMWLLAPLLAYGQLRTVELFISNQKGNCDCAQILRSLGRIAGVESVRRNTGPHFATIQMRSENAVRLQQIWDVVRDSGTSADETRLSAAGHLKYGDVGQLQFVIAHSGETFVLEPTEAGKDVCTDILLGRELLVNGTIAGIKGRERAVLRFDSLVETGD